MTTLTAVYNEEELGWVTQKVKLSVPTVLKVTLKKKGKVAIKKGNSEDATFPKIFISPSDNISYEVSLGGETGGMCVQVITSTEPNAITIN